MRELIDGVTNGVAGVHRIAAAGTVFVKTYPGYMTTHHAYMEVTEVKNGQTQSIVESGFAAGVGRLMVSRIQEHFISPDHT